MNRKILVESIKNAYVYALNEFQNRFKTFNVNCDDGFVDDEDGVMCVFHDSESILDFIKKADFFDFRTVINRISIMDNLSEYIRYTYRCDVDGNMLCDCIINYTLLFKFDDQNNIENIKSSISITTPLFDVNGVNKLEIEKNIFSEKDVSDRN